MNPRDDDDDGGRRRRRWTAASVGDDARDDDDDARFCAIATASSRVMMGRRTHDGAIASGLGADTART